MDSTGSSPIDDGTYQIKVSVKDTSEKTSYQLTTFTVDNTAPVILVTSPDEKESSMAYNLQFEGKIYDATQINSITLNVYDTEGNVKVTKQASLVGTSEWKVLLEGENELQIGQTSPKLTNGNYNYSVISSDKVGNTSVYFFHKEDIYKKYSGDSISIDEWAAFDKGDKETISGISEDERDEWLDELRIQVDPSLNLSSQTSFSYSDKPVASITWSSIETETNAMTQLNDGDPISGLITPPVGVDAPFKNDTFVAYIWRTKDDDGNVVPIYSDSDRVPDANLSIENVQTSRSFTIKTKDGNDSFGDAYSVAPSVGNTGEKSVYDNFYNRQPNGDNNNLLTDDLVLDVWQINSKVAKPAGGALTQPVMAINPVNGQVGFAFRNGALMMSMGSQDYSYDYWLCGLDVWTSIGFAYDDLGYGWGTAAGGDINNSSADSFALLSSRWGTGTLRDTDNGHNNGTNQIRPYTIGQKDYDDSNNSFVNIDKERFQSSSLATTVNVEDNASTVYLAYYDNINNEIRFHWGTFTTNTKTAKMVQDLFSDAYGKANALNGKDITNDVAKYRLDYTSLIAGQTQNTHPYTGTPTDTRVFATDGTPVCAGQYVSIAALRGMGNTVNGVADDAVGNCF